MRYIYKITSHETVDFAAHELKKYLRMMTPDGGDVRIGFDPSAKTGFRLGLMRDLGLDLSDARDTALDDILYIDADGEGGVIAGSNPRSVLVAVYEFLRQNGCRWLFPGVDGEYIPLKSPEAVRYRHKASCRFRGPCIEGAVSQEILLDTVDFLPKVGMNAFQMQFLIPTAFYKRYYNHDRNGTRSPEPVTTEQMLQWKTACESEMAKRGIQFHDVGHGWTAAPFGVDTSHSWERIDSSDLPEDARKYLALFGGKRDLYQGIALNTQFCMSSPAARHKVAEYIAEYALVHSNVDYIHVWLADDSNNHCECEECAKKTVSDWYMLLLNEIDAALAAKKLATRIVFIQYNETTWAPLVERIKNPDRFAMMLAPISRSYTRTLTDKTPALRPFLRNQCRMTEDLDEFMAYYRDWRRTWKGAAFAFEYHFWRHQMLEPSGLLLARRIFCDVEAYKANGVDGIIACGSQRSYFPTGFAYYVFARKQFDLSLSFEELVEDYFSHAFGERWQEFVAYLSEVSTLFGDRYLEREESKDPSKSLLYNPERAEKLRTAPAVLEKGKALISECYDSDERVRTVSVRLLEEHAAYVAGLCRAFALKADGNTEDAAAALDALCAEMSEREWYIEPYFDHQLAFGDLGWVIRS